MDCVVMCPKCKKRMLYTGDEMVEVVELVDQEDDMSVEAVDWRAFVCACGTKSYVSFPEDRARQLEVLAAVQGDDGGQC